jgi:TPR repeat protein
VLQVSETNRALAAEKKLALASERDRADALTRDLTSVRNELEASKKQIATLNTPLAVHSREPAVDSAQARMAESSSRTIEGKGRSPEQISGEAVASTSGRSSVSKLPRPEAPSAAREAASDLVPKVAAGTERSTSANAAPPSLVDEQRLLARANALLRQADISGARPLLQLALERGSARAAFMLAETYDARVLQSWRTSGISGDRTKARELYERAQAGGIEDAKERIETLNSGSARNSVGSR